MRERFASALLSILLVALASSSPPPSPAIIDLQSIPESAEFSGCGMGFKLLTAARKDPQLVFWWDFGDEAIVRVSGRNHRLKQIKSEHLQGRRPATFTEEWSDGEIRIWIVYQVTKGYYEGGDLKGKITVQQGKARRSFNVVGFKGC